ncbi:MAG: hypothetical protein JO113_05145 [Candidatus Eremiobacteraeota bacterium]|nr:hypothetical protein [Candidatus Eremiobacteraeota bacterium]
MASAALQASSSDRAATREAPGKLKAFELLKVSLSTKPSLPVEALIPTAIPQLDRLLGGGLPAGSVVTLEGATGRWSLAAGLVAAMTRRSFVAILDDGGLYPPALAETGVCLERVLVVPARKALAMARAADILLRSRICNLVLMPVATLRDAVWERLALLAQRGGVLLIVVAARSGAALSAAAGVRLHCALERIVINGERGLWATVGGFDVCVDVRKHKHMAAVGSAHVRIGHAPLR